MPRRLFKKFLPDPSKIKQNRYLSILGEAIHNSELWHLTKHSVAGAFFIGVFCAFLPIPFQTVLAALLAILFKRNLPLSVILVFISNPLTMTPMLYFNYWVGTLFVDQPFLTDSINLDDVWVWLAVNFNHIGKPLLIGSIVAGLFFGLLSYFAVQWFWVWQVRHNWKKRQLNRNSP